MGYSISAPVRCYFKSRRALSKYVTKLVILKNDETMKTIFSICTIIISILLPVSGQQIVKVGDKAPEFQGTADDGSSWNIKKFLGKEYIVVYFYPAAMSSGCTKQACTYRDHKENLKDAGIVVVGISGDRPEDLRLFKQANNLNFTLLSDEKGKIAEKFGVPVSDGGSMKKTVDGVEHELVRGVTEKRWTFIIGKDRKIIYKNQSVNPEKDSEEVLAFIKDQTSK
jgi:peroxiredoxin Q/BCP